MAAGPLLACLAAFLQSLSCLASDPWEWAGVYDFPVADHYVWSATRNAQGVYADPGMKLVIVKASAATDAGLHGAEAQATTLFNGAATTKNNGAEIDVENAAYDLVFDQRTWVTHFELHVDTPGAYVIFTEHMPTEFENGFHFLKTEAGADVNAVVEEGSGHHGHGAPAPTPPPAPCPWNEAWEWSGVFTLPASGYYTWNAARGSGGSYADATMKLVIVTAPNATAEGLASTTAAAQALWDAAAVGKNSGDLLQIGSAYTLTFDTHAWASHFYLQAAASGTVAFYGQHLPTEFEKDFHYFKDSAGADLEAAAQTSSADCLSASTTTAAPSTAAPTGGSWGEVLGGAFVTCLPTLLGVLFIAPHMAGSVREAMEKSAGFINSFASGVIFAAAVFLLLPEGLHLAGAGHTEVDGAWTWGTGILGGWFTCYLIAGLCKAIERSFGKVTDQSEDKPSDEPASLMSRMGTIAPVLLGDFFHNFTDGLVVGVAFKVCGGSFGWKLVGVTVAHELPQELADLAILVLDAKVPWHWATLSNFMCSLATVVGAIITFSSDVGQNAEGIMLAYGAGGYLYVACTELGMHMLNPKGSKLSPFLLFALQLLFFTVGTVLMGLVLLEHTHCAAPPAPSADGSPAPAPSGGHNHAH